MRAADKLLFVRRSVFGLAGMLSGILGCRDTWVKSVV
mgnify:FL=1|jgi:hypothetical protein